MRAVLSQHLSQPADSPPECKRKSELRFQIALLLVAVTAGYLLRFFGPVPTRQTFEAVSLENIAGVSALLAAVFAAMIVHELGHLLVALAFNFRFIGASLGPLRLQTLHGYWKFSFEFRDWFRASISAAPRMPAQWRTRLFFVIAAGPLATLFAAVLAFYFLQQPQSGQPFFTLFLKSFLQVNGLLFLLGLIPNRPDARVQNDMCLLLSLCRGGNWRRELELSVMLTDQVHCGVSPSDYPDALLIGLANWRGRPESELTFAHALTRWALDSQEWSAAEAWDARALALSESCSSRLRDQALASSACLDLLLRDDPDSARSKFWRVDMKSLFPAFFQHRARAAEHIALGRHYKAPSEIIRAQYALPRGIAAYNLERHLLEQLHMRALSSSILRSPKVRTTSA